MGSHVLAIAQTSVYFIAGFYRDNDIRKVTYFGIPIGSLKGEKGVKNLIIFRKDGG